MSKLNKQLKDLFYNPKDGLTSLNKFVQKANEANIDAKTSEIKDFYESQPINHLMKPVRKPKHFSSYQANYPGHIYQLDIIVYQKYKYHNYQYIICIVDIFSRYAIAKAMTSREMPQIIEKFKEMIEEIGVPYKLECDNEFNKKQFLEVLKKYNIKVRFSDPNELNKNPIVERFNATIEILLQKMRLVYKRYDWYNYLKDALENYNNTYHETIKAKPYDVFTEKDINHQDIVKVKYKYQPGDKVKTISNKQFDKIDVVKMSPETHIIENVKNNKIKLFGNDKYFKPYELSKVYKVDPNSIIDLTNDEPTKEYKEHKLKLLHKDLDIKQENIIETKRERKQNSRYFF